MKIEITDQYFAEKLKSIRLYGPPRVRGTAIPNIGPVVISPFDGGVRLYGIDAAGTNTIYSYTEIEANVSEPEVIFVPDINPIYEAIAGLDFNCSIEIDEKTYRLSNERFSLESEMDAGEMIDSLKEFADKYEPPDKLGKLEFKHIFSIPGKDLYRLHTLNRKTYMEESYMVLKGVLGTDHVTVDTDSEEVEFEPFTIYALDPFMYSMKDAGLIKFYLSNDGNFIELVGSFGNYVYMHGGE